MSLVDEPEAPDRESIDPAALGDLADDIGAKGLLQPVGVAGPGADGRYKLGFGHRRLLAHRLLERELIAARVWPAGTPLEDMRAAENLVREQLTPIEEARIVKRYLDRGQPLTAVARIMRRSAGWVEARRRLLDHPPDVLQAIREGRIGLGVAELLAQVDHEEYRASLVAEAERCGASLATVGVWLAHYAADRNRIVQNHLTALEIASSRESFIIFYACEACAKQVDYRETTAMRFCRSCAAELVRGLREASAEVPAGSTGSADKH